MADPVQNQSSVDMNTRGVQTGGAGGPSAGQKLAQVLPLVPAMSLAVLKTPVLPGIERAMNAASEQATRVVVEQGSKVASNLLTKLIRLFIPKF